MSSGSAVPVQAVKVREVTHAIVKAWADRDRRSWIDQMAVMIEEADAARKQKEKKKSAEGKD